MSIFPHLAVLGLAASLSSPFHHHQIDFKTTSPDGIQRINQLWLVTYINEAGLETVAQAKLGGTEAGTRRGLARAGGLERF